MYQTVYPQTFLNKLYNYFWLSCSYSGLKIRIWWFGFLLKERYTLLQEAHAYQNVNHSYLDDMRSCFTNQPWLSSYKNQSRKIKKHSEKPCLLHLDNSVQNELIDKNAQHLPFPFLFKKILSPVVLWMISSGNLVWIYSMLDCADYLTNDMHTPWHCDTSLLTSGNFKWQTKAVCYQFCKKTHLPDSQDLVQRLKSINILICYLSSASHYIIPGQKW